MQLELSTCSALLSGSVPTCGGAWPTSSGDGSRGEVAEEEPSEEVKVVPSERVPEILPDAVKLLSSARLTFNHFLSGCGNSEWVRDNLSIVLRLRKEVQDVIEDHQEALRRLNVQENLVNALDTLMPEIQEALAEENKAQAESSLQGSRMGFGAFRLISL